MVTLSGSRHFLSESFSFRFESNTNSSICTIHPKYPQDSENPNTDTHQPIDTLAKVADHGRMSLSARLLPINTLAVKNTAYNTFYRFLETEMSMLDIDRFNSTISKWLCSRGDHGQVRNLVGFWWGSAWLAAGSQHSGFVLHQCKDLVAEQLSRISVHMQSRPFALELVYANVALREQVVRWYRWRHHVAKQILSN